MYQENSQHETEELNGKTIQVSTLKGLITIVLVLGVMSGGISGALVATYLQPQSYSSGSDKDLSLNRSQTVVVDQSSMIQTIEDASESVVSIIAEKPESQVGNQSNSPFNFAFPGFDLFSEPESSDVQGDVQADDEDIYVQVSAGTGFVVTEDGHILTNKHVVNDETARYSIITKSGDTFEVEILGTDPINDLALIKVKDAIVNLPPPLEIGDSDELKIGQTVIAIGNSLGEFSHTVTTGIVSGIDRRVTAGDGLGFSEVLEEVIQTDAAINPGNSGGPLLNALGQAVGINTAMSQSGQLIGFAIPINDAISFIQDIIEHGKVIRPYMGVRYVLIDERIARVNDLDVEYGALLRRGDDASELAVIPGSPADKAGLEENDIIIEVEGEEVGKSQSLVRILSRYAPGDTVELKVLKDGEEQIIDLTLGEFQEEK